MILKGKQMEFNDVFKKGTIITDIKGMETGSTEIEFTIFDDNKFLISPYRVYKMHHYQDCCEEVCLEYIVGDPKDLLNTPLIIAEEITEETVGEDTFSDYHITYTFYKFATKNGYVDLRWYGASNGYYSETVDLDDITEF